MNKILFLTASLILTSLASAHNLECTSSAPSNALKSFTITAVDSQNPSASIPDQSLLDVQQSQDVVAMNFSNECDNSYGIAISREGLYNLISRKTTSVYAEVKYSDADMSADQYQVVNAVCKLAP